jgi:hypothetical protein
MSLTPGQIRSIGMEFEERLVAHEASLIEKVTAHVDAVQVVMTNLLEARFESGLAAAQGSIAHAVQNQLDARLKAIEATLAEKVQVLLTGMALGTGLQKLQSGQQYGGVNTTPGGAAGLRLRPGLAAIETQVRELRRTESEAERQLGELIRTHPTPYERDSDTRVAIAQLRAARRIARTRIEELEEEY